ncbi:MAG: glycosyltransferase involved in cell wall biosynthesis [Patiriisocius sp.]
MTSYLEKRALYPALIDEAPIRNLFNVVVIPCYNEPDILDTIRSLQKCEPPKRSVEVLIVINSSKQEEESILLQNERSVTEIKNFKNENPNLFFEIHVLHVKDLINKTAGVGLARKIGMDEAIYRFDYVDKKNEIETVGVITCLDADCTVDVNYLIEIEKSFLSNTKCPGASIKYAHDIDSDESNTKEIIDYELHLRYYNQGLKWSGFPFAFQTVGSSMVVRSNEYQRQGGMNKRKAGEDFYFLHKFIQLDGFHHIDSTTVRPSSRSSDRVPFGTGRAMLQMKEIDFMTYKFSAFIALKDFLDRLDELYSNRNDIQAFVESFESSLSDYILKKSDYLEDWQNIMNNTSSLISFKKRFFVWMNAFWVMKFLNYHKIEQGGGETLENASKLFEMLSSNNEAIESKKDLLESYRLLDRE